MGERITATIETAEERQAACVAMGSRAVGNCVECPAAVSCPILQLKQLSSEMVTASPDVGEAAGRDSSYADGGYDAVPSLRRPTAPTPNLPPAPKEVARTKQAATERAMRERLRQTSTIPQQHPGQTVRQKTYLELLMDGVTELVLADSIRRGRT